MFNNAVVIEAHIPDFGVPLERRIARKETVAATPHTMKKWGGLILEERFPIHELGLFAFQNVNGCVSPGRRP